LLKAIAKSLRNHRELVLNWFRAKKEISQAVVGVHGGESPLMTFRRHHILRSYGPG